MASTGLKTLWTRQRTIKRRQPAGIMRRIRRDLIDRRFSGSRELVRPLQTAPIRGGASVSVAPQVTRPPCARAFASHPLSESDDYKPKSLQEPRLPFFDPELSDSQWRETTHKLLTEQPPIITSKMIVLTEQTIRYWTTQRSAEAVQPCFRLLDLMFQRLQEHPILLSSGDLSHFYSGNYPRATHLLNAVVDAW